MSGSIGESRGGEAAVGAEKEGRSDMKRKEETKNASICFERKETKEKDKKRKKKRKKFD